MAVVNKSGDSKGVNLAVEFDYRLLYIILKKNYKAILITGLIIFCGFALYSTTMRPSYKTSALIKVESGANAGAMGGAGVAEVLSKIPLLSARHTSPTDFERALIQSPFILNKVIEELHLDIVARPHYFPVIGKLLAKNHGGDGVAKSVLGMDSYCWGGQKIVVNHLNVSSEYINDKLKLVALGGGKYKLLAPTNRVILVGHVGELLRSKDGVSIYVTQLVANEGNSFSIIKLDRGQVIHRLLKKIKIYDPASIEDNRRVVDTGMLSLSFISSSSQKVVDFLNALLTAAYKGGAQLMSDQASQTLTFINDQIPEVLRALRLSEQKLAVYQAKSGNLDIQHQFSYLLQEIAARQTTLEQLKLEKTDLLQKYTSTHPYVITLDNKISEMRKSVLDIEDQLHQLPTSDKEASELMREVKTKTQLYVTLLAKQQETKIIKAGVNSNIRVLSRAQTPPIKIPPKTPIVMLIGFLIAAITPLAFFLVRLIFSNKLVNAKQLEDAFGIDVKTILPYSTKQKEISDAMREVNNGDFVLAHVSEYDVVVESLRSLRTNLQMDLLEKGGKVISICSLSPSSGKSFVSCNIAYLFAELGMKVLLLEGDMRKGYLSKYMNHEKEVGLSNILAGEVDFQTVISQYRDTTLKFLPRGPSSAQTSNLLMSQEMDAVINEAKRQFDIIVIDTAPILLVTDGVLASRYADVNVMLLTGGRHSVQEVQTGVGILSRNNVEIDGFVLNFGDKKAEAEYSYTYWKYYGSYDAYSSSGYYSDNKHGA